MVGAFQMIGLCLSGAMGSIPLTWQEIDAFCNRSTYDLEDWQCETLINMSRNYISWKEKGKDVDCFSPWDDTSEEALQAHSEYMLRNSGKSFRKIKEESP